MDRTEQIHPEITLLFVEQAKSTFSPDPLLLDPDWVTTALFHYQSHPEHQPLNETHQDCVWGAEEIKPRSEWNITPEQAVASERQRQKWLEGRKKTISQLAPT